MGSQQDTFETGGAFAELKFQVFQLLKRSYQDAEAMTLIYASKCVRLQRPRARSSSAATVISVCVAHSSLVGDAFAAGCLSSGNSPRIFSTLAVSHLCVMRASRKVNGWQELRKDEAKLHPARGAANRAR